MSDEYFYIEEIIPNSTENDGKNSKNRKKNDVIDSCHAAETKKSQEIRLHEIEQQLEMAESRCNTLKGQVDYMKMIYNGMNDKESNIKPVKGVTKNVQPTMKRHLTNDKNAAKRKRNEKEIMAEQANYKNKTEESWKEVPSRDVELQYHTTISNMSTIPQRDINFGDTSAAVKSINNIITGITDSVNRLTQLHVHIGDDDPVGIQTVECHPRYTNQNSVPEKPYQSDTINVQVDQSAGSIKSKTYKKPKKKVKGVTTKNSSSKQDSVASVNDMKKRLKVTAKHVEKKTKLTQPVSAGDNSQLYGRYKRKQFGKLRTISSRTLLIKKSFNNENKTAIKMEKPEWKSDKLIELYHNSAAKIITASEDSLPNKKSEKISVVETKPKVPYPVYEKPENVPAQQAYINQGYKNPLSPIDEQERLPYGSYYKNYELPTIASKMKQVARTYFENFSFRTIPFVAAKSITPSHNLGVNIQQVLSIIKGRKPVVGISPTLAYNIELAANKLGSRPLSALVSTLGSRMNSNNRVACPLTRRYPNFSHLQEMAKDIPEETVEELAANFDDDNSKSLPAVGLEAGDKDPLNGGEKVWGVDPNKSEKCTCLQKQGVSFNDVYHKYVTDEKTLNKELMQKRLRNRPWNANRNMQIARDELQVSNEMRSNQICKKERSLKEVLKNLHDEFAALTERYDELRNEVNNGSKTNTNLLRELEKMERDLQNKEDEITMVMSLYKEVLALKQQVKVLKKRASQSTVVVSPFINRQREYKDMNAAGHLTKLLRHIQQFQGTLKNKSSM